MENVIWSTFLLLGIRYRSVCFKNLDVFPRAHLARGPQRSSQVGSGDPLVLGYTTQPSANILIFIIADAL